MATKRKKQKAETVQKVATSGMESQRFVLVGTYKGDQLTDQLHVCAAAYQISLWELPNGEEMKPSVPFPVPENYKFTFIDLFAGAGGLSIGLERARIHVVIANEIMHDFAATLAANHPDTNVINDDTHIGEAA